MGGFLESEKPKQAQFKASSRYFSDPARSDGLYKGQPRPFCLPLETAGQNLFPPIRKSAPAFFAAHKIKWHDGQNGQPSNHLCSSQVCCVNFLFPFAEQPGALARLLSPIFPEVKRMLQVECGQYVSFEWIGAHDYLGEKKNARNQLRSRGANCTSADAILLFERTDAKRQAVLIEWKYTESYGRTDLKTAPSGTDRVAIYRPLFDAPNCPFKKEILPGFEALFYEPFYQFMRQQFLAHEMEKAHELGADIVSLLHIAPAHNLDFCRVTSPALVGLGNSATCVWKRLVKDGRFISVATEDLFGHLSAEQLPEMQPWLEYIRARYEWVQAGTS
jgi:hypothetical protein